MSTTYSIHDVAAELDRLFANNREVVDNTEISHGYGQMAGHAGREHEDRSRIGWYAQGGNYGHPVIDIANEDIQRAGETLAAMESVRDLSDIERAFAAAGVRFELLV